MCPECGSGQGAGCRSTGCACPLSLTPLPTEIGYVAKPWRSSSPKLPHTHRSDYRAVGSISLLRLPVSLIRPRKNCRSSIQQASIVGAVLMLGCGGRIKRRTTPRVQLPAITPKGRAWNKGRVIGQNVHFCRSRCGRSARGSNWQAMCATSHCSISPSTANCVDVNCCWNTQRSTARSAILASYVKTR